MPEDKEDTKDPTAELAKKMEQLAKGVETATAGITSANKTLEQLQRENEILKAQIETRGTTNDDELDEDEEKFTPKAKAELKNEVRTEIFNDLSFKQQQDEWDKKAYTDFPELKNESSRFYLEAKEEMKKIYPVGYDKSGRKILPPDNVYIAASRVYARGQKEGWIAIPIRNDDEDGGGEFRREIKGKKINDIQRELCAFWKIDPKKVEERIKNR